MRSRRRRRPIADEDQIVGRAKAPASRRFFSFVGGSALKMRRRSRSARPRSGKEDRALLQEALYDLLECKRHRPIRCGSPQASLFPGRL